MEVDVNRVIELLTNQIAKLNVDLAVLQTQNEQLKKQLEEKPSTD